MLYNHDFCGAVSVKYAQIFAYLLIFPPRIKKTPQTNTFVEYQVAMDKPCLICYLASEDLQVCWITRDGWYSPLLQLQIRAKSGGF